MGILDALAVIGSGVGKGYRAGQDAVRQIMEERRKALLDERQQRLQESLAPSEIGLRTAQMGGVNADTALSQYKLGEEKAAKERLDQPITSGGVPFQIPLGGTTANIPGTGAGLTDYKDLIDEFLRNEGIKAVAGIRGAATLGAARTRLDYINSIGGTKGKTNEQIKAQILGRIFGQPISPFVDPAQQQDYIMGQISNLRTQMPELFQTAPTDTTKSKSTIAPSDSLSNVDAYKIYLNKIKTKGK